MNDYPWLELLTLIGEWGIVFVIYLEFESTRLDHFFDDAFGREHWEARQNIYKEFCSLETLGSEQFTQHLITDQTLKDHCDKQIALLNKIGSRIPFFPPLKARVLNWFPHSTVFLWEILRSYIDDRRRATGPYWADAFQQLTRKSVKHLLSRTSGDLTLLDPDRVRARDFVITRTRMEELVLELQIESPRREKLASLIVVVLLAVLAVAHLIRLAFRTPVTIGFLAVPMWVSVVAVVFLVLLAVFLWNERGHT